jgi:hypothetical protein
VNVLEGKQSMERIREALKPLTDWIPPEVRQRLDVEVWWLILFVVGLFVLLLVGSLVRGVWRMLFRRPRRKVDWDKALRIDLDECPLPVRPPAGRMLAVYHVAVRLRLVVLAPGGKELDVDATAVERLLDKLIPGLGAVAAHDRPFIRIWPPQLSQMGFTNAFHRCTVKHDPEDEPSRWILVAGRTVIHKQPLFLGLGLWAEEPSTLGRLNLEPHQWLDVLRLRDV